MTAPSAPTIYARFDGEAIRVRWLPVANATDYKLYADPTTGPTSLEADIPDDDLEEDGWFAYEFVPDLLPVYVAVTALNVGAEESAKSNELHAMTGGGGASFPPDGPHPPPTPASIRQPFG